MKSNPERVAWVVLLVALSIFCAIAIGAPLGVRWYVLYSQRAQSALVESLVGTVVVEPPVGSGPMPLVKGASMTVPPGTTVYVDETSEAVITFFDHSFMRIFPGSTMRLDQLSAPRFAAGREPDRISLTLLAGRVRIGTSRSLQTPLHFRVNTLYAQATLGEDGSYALEVVGNRADVAVYRGEAHVEAAGEEQVVRERQRTEVLAGAAPQPVVDVARNLIVNGDLEAPLTEWRVFNDQGTDGGDVDGRAELVLDEGHNAVRLVRAGATGNHCETVLEQVINKVLPDPTTSLVVRATVKVRYQALSGGGYLSSEYPLMIRVTYRDVYDSEAEWVQGFYYQNYSGNPTTYGLQIPQDRWFLYESGNLLNTLRISPYKIVKVRVYAAGWDYESLIADVNLIAE
jgi:hypothetical protein